MVSAKLSSQPDLSAHTNSDNSDNKTSLSNKIAGGSNKLISQSNALRAADVLESGLKTALLPSSDAALLSQDWIEEFRKIIRHLSTDQNAAFSVPCLDNSRLLDTRNRLRPGLEESKDYSIMSWADFECLCDFLGLDRQIAVKRRVIPDSGFHSRPIVELYPPLFHIAIFGSELKFEVEMESCLQSLEDLLRSVQSHLGSNRLFNGESGEFQSQSVRIYHSIENNAGYDLNLLSILDSAKLSQDLRSLCLGKYVTIDFAPFKLNQTPKLPNYSQSNILHNNNPAIPGAWPSHSKSFQLEKNLRSPGTMGLGNLGNTCFMNSALQCLSNTVPLTSYFLDGTYKREINATNPLGMNGEVAEAYGALVNTLWRDMENISFAPRDFKYTIGRFAPQFNGYQQHDSQELLAFLLDGLHEDLNRIKKKPYVEMPEYDGSMSNADFASKLWELHRCRNDSVVVDHFQGQYKSTLVCPECNHISVTFDPYMYLTLPLPIHHKVPFSFVFVPVDLKEDPSKWSFLIESDRTIGHMKEMISTRLQCKKETLSVVEIFSNKIFKIFEDEELIGDIGKNDVIFVYQSKIPVDVRLGQKRYIPSSPDHDGTSDSFLSVFVTLKKRAPSSYSLYSNETDFGYPILISIPSKTSLSALYEEILSVLQKFTKINLSESQSNYLLGSKSSDIDEEIENIGREIDGKTLSQKPWFSVNVLDCSNERDDIILSSSSQVSIIFEESVFAFIFSPENTLYRNPHDYPANGDSEQTSAKENIKLFQCFEEFAKSEQLGEEDAWFCPKCRKHQQATKKLDIWTTADILVIHLKRFSHGRHQRNKIDAFVDFPIESLDLTEFVKGKSNEPILYDLFAISNHYGGMGGGHYTAYAKNPIDDNWYDFDDSRVSKISSDSIKSSNAYLLFYQRRSTANKLTIPQYEENMELSLRNAISDNNSMFNGLDANDVRDSDTAVSIPNQAFPALEDGNSDDSTSAIMGEENP